MQIGNKKVEQDTKSVTLLSTSGDMAQSTEKGMRDQNLENPLHT